MNKEDNPRIVLVTGGSRGIGAAISRRFAREGCIIAVNYVQQEERANDFLHTLPGEDHRAFRADVGHAEQCAGLIEKVLACYGKIDVLVNNAGIHEQHPFEQVDYENWERIFQETLAVNLFGPARLMYLCAKQMETQGYGRIVNISSRGAFRGEPDQPAYGASKAGLNALSQSLAQKLAPKGIFIGIVAPGFVETEMVADLMSSPRGDEIRKQSTFGRVAKPEEVAEAAYFLASPGTEFMTGTIIDVNGASYLRS
ncbi:MAG: SDR family oxidoreductase [Saprospiraceae bacterium]|nr:SDR family oxidoreductase [Saprospiraceae bacterium]